MAKRPSSFRVNVAQVKEVLQRHGCPVPYHEVRTRFLGNIASPDMSASPLRVVENLWGGELPPFDTMDAANELIGALVNGLWNALTRHQKRTEPFRLVRVQGDPTPETLARLARVRQQEIDGFVEGVLHGADEIDLPEKASRALESLREIRGMMAGTVDLVQKGIQPEDAAQLATTLKHLGELQRIIEREMHVVVLDCTRSRRAAMGALGARGPTMH